MSQSKHLKNRCTGTRALQLQPLPVALQQHRCPLGLHQLSLSNAGTNNQASNHNQLYNDTQMDRYTIQMLASLPGVRCYVDASTALDHPSQQPRLAGLGIFFVNTQVQPAQTIYIKAHMPATQSVIMAEAAALALAALVNNRLGLTTQHSSRTVNSWYTFSTQRIKPILQTGESSLLLRFSLPAPLNAKQRSTRSIGLSILLLIA